MIELKRDCIWLAQEGGEAIPCSVEDLTFEVVGGGSADIEPEVLRNAASAVLHYFKVDQGRTRITLGEFAEALARVLMGLGYPVEVAGGSPGGSAELVNPNNSTGAPEGVRTTDLRILACESGKMGELSFFPRLHSALRESLADGVRTVEFRGLRGAVKQLLGKKHWSKGCRELEERILESIRNWYAQERAGQKKALVIR